jgi:hypothetical protein
MAAQNKFLHHTACSNCGSSDANAVYADGSLFCFSCSNYVANEISGYVSDHQKAQEHSEIFVPHDIGNEFPQECIDWINKYEITVADLISYGIKWSPSRKQLIYIYQKIKDDKGIGCVQARNFAGGPKYYNQGDVNDVLPIYSSGSSDLIIVEDVMSAIKCTKAWFVDALPLLGSHLSYYKMALLKGKKYERVWFWLDHDKYSQSVIMGNRLKMMGIQSDIIVTEEDPKVLPINDIATICIDRMF